MSTENHNLIVTGIARSGTTLACAILNELPNVVALPEPMEGQLIAALTSDPQHSPDKIGKFLAQTRRSINEHGIAPARLVDGELNTNFFEELPATGDLRKDIGRLGEVRITKPLDDDFLLAIKYPNLFLVLLPYLVNRFQIIALVRHPLAVLSSWSTIDAPVGRGRAPMVEMFDLELSRQLAECDEPIERRIILMAWCFRRLTYLPRERIVRYEDVMASRGRVISSLLERTNPDYSTCFFAKARVTAQREDLRARLQHHRQAFSNFYPDI